MLRSLRPSGLSLKVSSSRNCSTYHICLSFIRREETNPVVEVFRNSKQTVLSYVSLTSCTHRATPSWEAAKAKGVGNGGWNWRLEQSACPKGNTARRDELGVSNISFMPSPKLRKQRPPSAKSMGWLGHTVDGFTSVPPHGWGSPCAAWCLTVPPHGASGCHVMVHCPNSWLGPSLCSSGRWSRGSGTAPQRRR